MGAGDSPTHRNVSGSPVRSPAIRLVLAELSMLAKICSEVRRGLPCKSNAAPPETWGHAMEVPLNATEPVSESAEADMMALPGAMMLLQVP